MCLRECLRQVASSKRLHARHVSVDYRSTLHNPKVGKVLYGIKSFFWSFQTTSILPISHIPRHTPAIWTKTTVSSVTTVSRRD